MGCFRLSPFSSSVFYKYSTASEQSGFLLFRCKRKHYFKILRKIEKIKMRHSRESNHGSPAFRATALTFRLPWHVLIFSILAPYGLLSAFAFFKQRIYIYISLSFDFVSKAPSLIGTLSFMPPLECELNPSPGR